MPGQDKDWSPMTTTQFWELYRTRTVGEPWVRASELTAMAPLSTLLAYPRWLLEEELSGRSLPSTRRALELRLEALVVELECRYGNPASYRKANAPADPFPPLRWIDPRTLHYIDPETGLLGERWTPRRDRTEPDGRVVHVRRFRYCRSKPLVNWQLGSRGRGIARWG
jgi:hypothetical protein